MAAAKEEEEEEAVEKEEEEGGEEGLREMERLLEELYHFRDELRKRRREEAGSEGSKGGSGGDAGSDALEAEVARTLTLMEAVTVSPASRARSLLLQARALSLAPKPTFFTPKATTSQTSPHGGGGAGGHPRVGGGGGGGVVEELLGRALKLEPKLGEAWSKLGEERWKLGDLEGARSCFRRALREGEEDPEVLRSLSMALRAEGPGGDLRESLRLAEEAVRKGPRDGRNWYVLANAYVSLFFAMGQNPQLARRALGAYGQAERVDPAMANDPDLHLNRAALLQYLEKFQGALEGLGRAAALAPEWEEPRKRFDQLEDFLGKLCTMLANGAKQKVKRRRGLAALPEKAGLSDVTSGLSPAPLSALRPGPNPRSIFVGRVLFSLSPEEGRVPYTLGVSDPGGAVAAVTVYNAAPGWGVGNGGTLSVPQPHLSHHHHQYGGKTFSFLGIRVHSPLGLLVNGKRPQSSGPTAPAAPKLRFCPDP